MTYHHFITSLREPELLQAIREAEAGTTGEVRVCVTRSVPEHVGEAAQAALLKMGMDKTRDRNAVLIYFAPRTQTFAVVGDERIHVLGGQELWKEAVAVMTTHLAKKQVMEAVVAGVRIIGDALRQHFPDEGSEPGNELPDEIHLD